MPKAQSKPRRDREAERAALSDKLTGKSYERELARLTPSWSSCSSGSVPKA